MVAGRPGTHGTLAHQHVELDNTEEDVIVIILHLQMVVQSVKEETMNTDHVHHLYVQVI